MFNFLKKDKDGNLTDFLVDYVDNSKALAELALETGIGRIAGMISKCGFHVFSADNTDLIDYRLNVKPNENQTASDFWSKAVIRMIKNADGCLIIPLGNKGLFMADSWSTDSAVTSEIKYFNVTITNGENSLTLNKIFKASDVIRLKYTNPRITNLLNEANGDFSEMFGAATTGFSAKAPKIAVTVPGQLSIRDSTTGKPITSNEYAQQIAEKIGSTQIKSIVKHSGIDVSTIDCKSSLSSTDLENLRQSIYGNVAAALGVPTSVLMGNVAEQANNEFLTYACEPIIKAIDDALNGTLLTKEEYARGDRILINTLSMKHIDVIESAAKLDKLYSNGWNHNDILKLLGQPTINEEWAEKRRFTKNYTGNEDEI